MDLKKAIKMDLDAALKKLVEDAYTLGYKRAKNEIVRCKDCDLKHIENSVWVCPFGLSAGEDFFCGYGKRIEE